MKKDAEKFAKQRDLAKRGLSKQYDNTILCQSFYNDEGASYTDTIQFAEPSGRKRRATVRFQKIQQSVDSVVGFLAQNRRQARYVARVNGTDVQQLYSRNMNALYDYHRSNTNADQLESRQDLDVAVCGYGAIDTDLSYIVGRSTMDPHGEILKMRIDPMRVYWDPKSKAGNLIDARFVGYYDDYALEDALDLFQGSDEEDFEKTSDSTAEDKSGYVYNPWGGLYDRIKMDDSVEWSAKEENMVRVYNHQWFEYETFYRAKNPLYLVTDVTDALFMRARMDVIKSEIKSYAPDGLSAGDMFDFDPTKEVLTFDESTKRKLVEEFGELIQPVGFKRKCFYTMVVSGRHVFKKFKSVSQQGFSIKFKTGQYNERGKYWVGMVNSMVEPQKYYNKALTELMFTIASNSKGGVMVEEGAVSDISDFESKWAKTDAVIEVLSGALTGGKIQEKARAMVPTGLESIISLSESAISANGVDPAFLGEANGQETGILYKRRIRQIIGKMWWLSDAVTLYQKEDARLCADLIRVWVQNNEGTRVLVSITGEEGAQEFLVVSEDAMAAEYDIVIQPGAKTPEDREETAQLIGVMGDKYLGVGNLQVAGALYAESVKMLTLDGDVKNRLTKVLVGDGQVVPMEQYQQLQQQLAQLQGALTQAQVQNMQSQTALNMARVEEAKASAGVKTADTLVKVEEAEQKNMETQVIRAYSGTDNVSVVI